MLVARNTPCNFITAVQNLECWVIFIKPLNRCSFIFFTHSSLASPVIWCLIALVESTRTLLRSYNKLGGTKWKVNISVSSCIILLRNTLCTDGHWKLPINMGSVPFSFKSSSIERDSQFNFRTSAKLHGSFGTLSESRESEKFLEHLIIMIIFMWLKLISVKKNFI